MKKFKVFLSFICALACFLTVFVVPSGSIKASETEYPENLIELYPSDFGIADGVYNSNMQGGSDKIENFINTIFTMDFELTGNDFWVSFANPDKTVESYKEFGLCVKFLDADKITIEGTGYEIGANQFSYIKKELSSSVAGVKFYDEAFRFQISFEAVDNDSDGEKDDLKLGVFFNYVLYNNQYFYVNDAVKYLTNKDQYKCGNYFVIRPDPEALGKTDDGTNYVRPVSYEIYSPEKTVLKDTTVITPADFGINNMTGVNDVATAKLPVDMGMNAKLFRVKRFRSSFNIYRLFRN